MVGRLSSFVVYGLSFFGVLVYLHFAWRVASRSTFSQRSGVASVRAVGTHSFTRSQVESIELDGVE